MWTDSILCNKTFSIAVLYSTIKTSLLSFLGPNAVTQADLRHS
jgi:hypothetical protein